MSAGYTRLRPSHWAAVMNAAAKAFPPGNRFGVFAFGIGPRVAKGRETRTTTLNVYVRHKHAKVAPPVRSLSVRVGSRRIQVRPDVIATGRLPRANDAASAIFTGVHTGAAIWAGAQSPQAGGIACLLGGDGPTHLVTAGHIFERNAKGTPVFCASEPGGALQQVGTLAANLLDMQVDGMSFPIDAAAVLLTPAGQALAQQGGGAVVLKDSVPTSNVGAVASRAFLPTSNDYSRPTQTLVGPVTAHMKGGARPAAYTVTNVIGTAFAVTREGDSGTTLVSTTQPSLGLGICVGEFQMMSLFEPLERAVTFLAQALGDTNMSICG